MSESKTERLMNLLIALLTDKGYVTKKELREQIEKYRDLNDIAFGRKFERDKSELRGLGINIEVAQPDGDGTPVGYRIVSDDFELPEVTFSAREREVLGLAAKAWPENGPVEMSVRSAIMKLKVAGIDLDLETLNALAPMVSAQEPSFEKTWQAVNNRVRLTFTYNGAERTIEPWQMANRHGAWYVIGYDIDAKDLRTFKLARLSGAEAKKKANSYPRADAATIDDALKSIAPRVGELEAIVALREGHVRDLYRRSSPAQWDEEIEGFEIRSLLYDRESSIVEDICAAGDHAIALSPPGVRDGVITALQAVLANMEGSS